MLGPIGTQELVVIFVLILLLFGAKKVPDIMKSFGEGMREFRKSSRDIMREFEDSAKTTSTTRPRPRPTTATRTAAIEPPEARANVATGSENKEAAEATTHADSTTDDSPKPDVPKEPQAVGAISSSESGTEGINTD